ncbi:hypothetical protein [Streptomyces sp. XH2]|uniref:hypothetical protein n=1 Tax=Streptomyces sp. XH2 TaxID=3412483 RepID=UPI003C7977B7
MRFRRASKQATPIATLPLPSAADIPADLHLTILVLSDGTVHGANAPAAGTGALMGSMHAAWPLAQAEAQRLGRPVRVSVGQQDGTITAYIVYPDGRLDPAPTHPQPAMPDHFDSRWLDGALNQHPMVEAVRAAHCATDWRAAQVAASRMAAYVRAELGDDHPHTVLAAEFEAFFALHARDWTAAVRLYTAVAEGRHRLSAPPGDTQRALHNAVAAWLNARTDRLSGAHGYALAHLLIRIAPHDHQALSAVLRSLPPAPSA